MRLRRAKPGQKLARDARRNGFKTCLLPATSTLKMGFSFDYAPERPEDIEAILNGLDRYNPETTARFQEYVSQQCENQTYDCYANLALLKLYVQHIFDTHESEQTFFQKRGGEGYALLL